MSLFDKFFKKSRPKEPLVPMPAKEIPLETPILNDEWEEVPGFVATEPATETTVSIIATAIAAGDRPDSSFTVKRVLKRNPEVELVSLIASCLAAEALPDSQFCIKKIAKKK